MLADEQQEAEIVEELKKFIPSKVSDGVIFKVRKQFFDRLVEMGMPVVVAAKTVVSIDLEVAEDGFDGPIYKQAFEIATKGFFDVWQTYSREIHEEAYLIACKDFTFVVPL